MSFEGGETVRPCGGSYGPADTYSGPEGPQSYLARIPSLDLKRVVHKKACPFNLVAEILPCSRGSQEPSSMTIAHHSQNHILWR